MSTTTTVKQFWLLLNGRISSKQALLCTELLLTAFQITFLSAHSRGTDASAIREITVVSDDNYPFSHLPHRPSDRGKESN